MRFINILLTIGMGFKKIYQDKKTFPDSKKTGK